MEFSSAANDVRHCDEYCIIHTAAHDYVKIQCTYLEAGVRPDVRLEHAARHVP